jgi:hypothetical protein
MRVQFSILFVLLITFSSSAQNDSPFLGEKKDIASIIENSIGWALNKDRPLLESIISHDSTLFIFNPGVKANIGWNNFAKNFDFWMSPAFKATHFDVRELRINISQSGNAAWYSCILDDCYEISGKPGCWKDTRWTGVLEKRNSKWIIVQMHFSFLSDK